MKLTNYILFGLIALTSGCATKQKIVVRTEPPVIPRTVAQQKPIDTEALRIALKIGDTDLGFQEKSFNTCSLPLEQRPRANCETRYFSFMHIQIVCRDSEGTVEHVSEGNMSSLANKSIHWVLPGQTVQVQSSHDGFAKVVAVNEKSVARKLIILKIGAHSMGLRAQEIKRIVVPSNWCR